MKVMVSINPSTGRLRIDAERVLDYQADQVASTIAGAVAQAVAAWADDEVPDEDPVAELQPVGPTRLASAPTIAAVLTLDPPPPDEDGVPDAPVDPAGSLEAARWRQRHRALRLIDEGGYTDEGIARIVGVTPEQVRAWVTTPPPTSSSTGSG